MLSSRRKITPWPNSSSCAKGAPSRGHARIRQRQSLHTSFARRQNKATHVSSAVLSKKLASTLFKAVRTKCMYASILCQESRPGCSQSYNLALESFTKKDEDEKMQEKSYQGQRDGSNKGFAKSRTFLKNKIGLAQYMKAMRRQQKNGHLDAELSEKFEEAEQHLSKLQNQPLESTKQPASISGDNSASRGQVYASCFGTGVFLTLLAALLQSFRPTDYTLLPGASAHNLGSLWHPPSASELPGQLAVVVLAVASITFARWQALQTWPAFAEATQRSNKQVLSSLGYEDILVISLVSGFSEELFFRGALLPTLSLDIRGAVLSGVLFGLLHVTGRRNLAFAGWASFLGITYGCLTISMGNIWVSASTHACANIASAVTWKKSMQQPTT